MNEIPADRPDLVIEQKIQEATGGITVTIDEIDKEIAAIQKLIKKSPFLRLKHVLGQDSDEAEQLYLLNLRRDIERRKLEDVPNRIAGQIKRNRRSYQLFWIRNFLGDPVNDNKYREFNVWKFYLIERDFPYDDGGDFYEKFDEHKKAEIDEKRRLHFPNDTMRGIKDTLNNAGKVDLTLYDTSDPWPQMQHGFFIDLLVDLGFALDHSMRRGIAAMHADMSIDTHALDEFAGQSPFKSGWRFINENWLNISSGEKAEGYLRAQGDAALAETRFSKNQSPEMNPVLSKLCHDWGIPHLYAQLSYQRNGPDIKVELRLQKEIIIVDAQAVDSSLLKIP